MAIIKTAELTGAALDWAVAKCAGLKTYIDDGVVCLKGQPFDDNAHYWLPTQNWPQGGPIIEREKIGVVPSAEDASVWVGSVYEPEWKFNRTGPTPLIAAMRCYVASKLGDSVDVPNELI